MNKILTALADDNLCINPTTFRGNKEYREAIKGVYETAENLDAKLNDEEKKLFEKFRDFQSDESHIYEVERFIRGFRVGALMMVEVFAGSAELVLGEEGD